MTWNTILNMVQLTFYVAGIVIFMLLGSHLLSTQAQMQRVHERMMNQSLDVLCAQ